jgi:serine/threonine protein kinase
MSDAGRLARGQVIDEKYELVAPVSRGPRGELWRGVRRGAGGFARPVAIKVVPSDRLARTRDVARFLGRARLAAELRHPNIVQIEDLCRDPVGRYHLVMEWVDGVSFRDFLRGLDRIDIPVSWPLVVSIGVGVLRGLAAAHSRTDPDGTFAPVLHSELTPERVLVGVNGVGKVSGFGMLGAASRPDRVIGYQAPEIVLRRDAWEPSDVFSVGAMLWEALVGLPLFTGDVERANAFHAGRLQLPSLAAARPTLPERLTAAIDRALSHCPDHRFTTADELAAELTPLLAGLRWKDSPQAELGRHVLDARTALIRKVRGTDPDALFDDPNDDFGPQLARGTDPNGLFEVSETDILTIELDPVTDDHLDMLAMEPAPSESQVGMEAGSDDEPYASIEIRGAQGKEAGRPVQAMGITG